MKFIKASLLLLLIIQSVSCAQYYVRSGSLNSYITEWLNDNNFQMIDKSIALIDKSHPEYNQIISRKSDIKKRKIFYVSQTEHKAQLLKKQGKWTDAIDEYNNALKQLPDNKQLKASRTILIKQHNKLINNLKKDMLIKRAHALIEYETVYHKLEYLAPDDYNAQKDIRRHKNEKQEVANHLIQCSEFALNHEDYALAEECLQLSSQLINTETVRRLLKKTKNKRKSIEDRKRAKELLQTYKSAYAAGDLPKARYHINTLITLQPQHTEAIRLKSSLDKEINSHVDKGIAKGRELYSQNKINKALDIWQKLILMDPDNEELKTLISRAEKVSKKIETLSPAPAQ